MSGTFYVDDVRITVPRPALTIVSEGGFLKLGMANLTAGKTYELRATADFSAWNTEGVTNATSDTAEWIVVPAQARTFYQLLERSSP